MNKINKKELHDIFTRFINYEQNAYNELYEKYYKLIYGIAFSVLKNKEDSEDITSEVFTKIYKLDKEKLPVSNEASWLFTVTRNECFSHIRKAKQNVSIDEMYEVPSNLKEIQEIIDSEYYNYLIKDLTEQEKTIISLKVLSNFTFSQIAQILNIPMATVQWKYYKAINSLKISIGSLAGAVLAFVLAFVRVDNIKSSDYTKSGKKTEVSNNSESTNMDVTEEKREEASEPSQEDEVNISIQDKIESSAEIEQNQNVTKFESENEHKGISDSFSAQSVENTDSSTHFNIFNKTCISVGIVLLITFIIFFKKYQQKFKRKTSK